MLSWSTLGKAQQLLSCCQSVILSDIKLGEAHQQLLCQVDIKMLVTQLVRFKVVFDHGHC